MSLKDLVVNVGDYITVVEWHQFTNSDGETRQDRSYTSDTMIVLSIDKNLLFVRKISQYDFEKQPFTLNLDRLIVRKLSKEYVDAVLESIKELT